MNMKAKAFIAVWLAFIATVGVLTWRSWRAQRIPSPVEEENVPEEAATRPPVLVTNSSFRTELASLKGTARDRFLKQASATNAALQAWGKELMIKEVNLLLAKAPLYGLTSSLAPERVIGTTHLAHVMGRDRVELWLHTTDKKHRFRYENGLLWDAHALDADYLRKSKDELPHAMPEGAPEWGDDDAKKAFVDLMTRIGVPQSKIAEGVLQVEPYEVELNRGDGSGLQVVGKIIKPYYTVRLVGPANDTMAEAHFRATAGGWLPTFLNRYPREIEKIDPAFEEAVRRFF